MVFEMGSVLIFIIVVGVLIFFHELGHFLVARLFGVGVERFSLGFGPRIVGKMIGRTDYRISAIPLGGYVKMIGEEPDADLEPEEIPLSFTHKHVGKRSLIVFAGPFFNVLLAVIIFSGAFYFSGLPSIRPYIRSIDEDGPAAATKLRTGDRIVSIDGRRVNSWRDIDNMVENSDGRELSLQIDRHGEPLNVTVSPRLVHAKNLFGDDVQYYDLGLSGLSAISTLVDKVVDGMPAEKAGIKAGDRIVAINGQPIDRWEDLQHAVSASKGHSMAFTIQRGERRFTVNITPSQIQEPDLLGVKQTVYRIGIQRPGVRIPAEDKMTVALNPFQAMGQGLSQSWKLTELTGYTFLKLIQRKVPMDTLGGPIRIAQMAHQQAELGILALLNFIAVISINLAILNLLPIPVLDGGHLLFFAVEAILRRPVSLRTRETAQQIGIFVLLMLMVFVIYNDISMTFFK
jgi:regulator of sigma E protease